MGGILDNVVFVVLSTCCVRVYFGRGMCQRPSTSLRFPCIMGFLFFVIMASFLENVAIQSSSQSLLIDIRGPVLRFGSKWPCCACDERVGARGTVRLCVDFILWPFAASTVGPMIVGIILVHEIMSSGAM